MKKIGQICAIDPSRAEKYIEYHRNIPKEIRDLIRACNIRNYRIYYRNGILFSDYDYVGDDYEADMKKMSDDSDNQKWWDLVRPLMSPLADRKKGEFWADMELVFEQE